MNLTSIQINILQELVNIGVGQAAGVLNDMSGSHIHLFIPYIELLSPEELQPQLEKRFHGERISAVRLNFGGSFAGSVQLVFPTASAYTLVAILTGEEPGTPDLDAVKIGTLSEVGNIVINGVMGAISNVLQQNLNYELPICIEGTVAHLLASYDFPGNNTVVMAQASFLIEQLQIQGDIILIFKVGSFDVLLNAVNQVLEGA